MTTKEKLHRLIDDLPEHELAEAERLLERLHRQATDPLLQLLAEVPEDDEPETEEEAKAVREAREELTRGEFVTLDEIKRELRG